MAHHGYASVPVIHTVNPYSTAVVRFKLSP